MPVADGTMTGVSAAKGRAVGTARQGLIDRQTRSPRWTTRSGRYVSVGTTGGASARATAAENR